MIFKSDKIPVFTEEEKKAFANLMLPEYRTDWNSKDEQIIQLLKRVERLKQDNAYLRGKVEVFEGVYSTRFMIKASESED